MKRVHIVGRKRHGKTTLVTELVREFARRGIRVGTVKHSSHVHELDVPGKDSYRQRMAGANPAVIVTRDLIGVYAPRDPQTALYDRLASLFSDCGLVLVEGHVDCPGPKIEVWRRAVSSSCLALERDDIAAVVTDDQLPVQVPVWPRSDIVQLANHLLAFSETV